MYALDERRDGFKDHLLDGEIPIDAANGEIFLAVAPHASDVPKRQVTHPHVEPALVLIVHGHLIIRPFIRIVIGGGLAFQPAGFLRVLVLHAVIHIGKGPGVERMLVQIGIRDHPMAGTEGVHLRYDRLKQMPYFLLP